MKLMMPIMLMLMFWNNFKLLMISLMLILMLMIIKSIMISTSLFNFMMMDNLSIMLIILSLISCSLIFISSMNFKSSSKLILLILITLILIFTSSNTLIFYTMFELVLIPTLILITKKGNQSERLQAGMYLMIYTILASLPLLLGVIILPNNNLMYFYTSMIKMKFPMIFMLAFMVKMPMFLSHLWLPKAHVEAPMEGSMILAAVLLKLGGYGIIRFSPLFLFNLNKMTPWIVSISLLGAMSTSMNCIRQKDLKALIAYSSVAHMAMVLSALFFMNTIPIKGALIMMFAHGLSSSALFFLVNLIYMKFHTRNILSFKSLFSSYPNLTFWWMMFISANISAPPTINIFSELLMIMGFMSWSMYSTILLFISSMTTASFSLLLFVNIIHNKMNMKLMDISYMKVYSSLYSHLIPLMLISVKMEMMLLMISLNKTMICGIMNDTIINMAMLMMITSILSLMLSLYLLMKSTMIFLEMPIFMSMNFNMSVSLILDWYSTFFQFTVMLISSMILMFSKFYIPKPEHKQFSLLLLMFVLSMSILIFSNNLVFMLLGWDGLGLSSFILVIYYQNSNSASSGMVTILSNRIGDVMIIMSIAILSMNMNWNFQMSNKFPLLVMIMLMIASMSKSAQFPFSAWLPAAMAAPTPISALVHSSTLVTAGVFLMLRILNFMPYLPSFTLLVISSSTALLASMSANWEQDMKKIIALSTLSQIAMMMFAMSMGALSLTFFHLIIHAMFKSSMFLCAGIMIHNSSYQDMRMMSSTMNNTPIMSSMLGVSSMALMGIPFMSGFFSKDMIIQFMLSSNFNMIMIILMISSIGMTATYSARMIKLGIKNYLKLSPDNLISNYNPSDLPVLLMSPISITMGTMMIWMLPATTLFLFPPFYFKMIILALLMGLVIALIINFKSLKFSKMGESSISLWYMHYLTTFNMNIMAPFMVKFNMFDKTWQETYGSNSIYSQMMLNSTIITKSSNSMILMILGISLIPIPMLMAMI